MPGTDVPLRCGPVVLEIGRWVYGTVILMTVLVVSADEGPVTYGVSVAVVVTTMLATFLAHLFAHVMAALNDATAGLDRREFMALLGSDAQYLLVTLPPLGLLLVGALGAFNAPTAVKLILWSGVALLAVVGALAGRRIGLGPWGIAASATVSGALGLLLLAAEVLLKL